MASTDRSRRVVTVALAALLVAGCSSVTTPSDRPLPSVHASSPDGTTTAGASPSAGGTPSLAADPAAPYDADDILEAMANSRRPGGVPASLQTQEIAGAVASRILTFDGEPWVTMAIGGSCGPSTCTLEVAGTPQGAAGEDLYVMSVTPSSGEIALVEASLAGLDPELLDRLDALARADAGPELDGLVLAGARWQLPPDSSLFVLSYRSGGEEGAPAREVVLDVTTGTIRAD